MKLLGKLKTVCKEMDTCNIQILGICETNWNGYGQENKAVLFSSKEGTYSHRVAKILAKEPASSLTGYSQVNERIMKAKTHNINIIDSNAPTSLVSNEDGKFLEFNQSRRETSIGSKELEKDNICGQKKLYDGR